MHWISTLAITATDAETDFTWPTIRIWSNRYYSAEHRIAIWSAMRPRSEYEANIRYSRSVNFAVRRFLKLVQKTSAFLLSLVICVCLCGYHIVYQRTVEATLKIKSPFNMTVISCCLVVTVPLFWLEFVLLLINSQVASRISWITRVTCYSFASDIACHVIAVKSQYTLWINGMVWLR
jgi:hypothetical protein